MEPSPAEILGEVIEKVASKGILQSTFGGQDLGKGRCWQ
jgi:hypothetical protein